MTLSEAIAETMRRAEKDQEFLRKTLEMRRKQVVAAEKTNEAKANRYQAPQGEPTDKDRG